MGKNLSAINQGFGVVTVINATCVPVELLNDLSAESSWENYCLTHTPEEIGQMILQTYNSNKANCCKLDTLKIANINMEGPSKTITGGQYASPLLKFGKTATCEMQDALGHPDALQILGGVEVDASKGMHFTSKFGKPVAIIGDTYVIDRETADQVEVSEIIYQFLPDSIISLTQDAEGDATVFDLNGSLIATDVKAGVDTIYHGAFYSIVDKIQLPTQSTGDTTSEDGTV